MDQPEQDKCLEREVGENERRLKDDLNDRLRTSSATSVPFSSRRTEIVGGTENVEVYILSDLISSSVSIYL